jgi:hypothetical protein
MIVNVYGLPLRSKKTLIALEEAAKFYADILLEDDIKEHIELDIDIDFDMNCAGHCVTEDEEEYPRIFTIYLNPEFTNASIFDTLAHEMIHLKQFAKGELYNILAMNVHELSLGHVWMGQKWIASDNESVYYDSPWEQDAYGKQVGLYHRWLNYKESLNNDI